MSGRSEGNPARVAWSIAGSLVAFMFLFAAGCGDDDDSGSGSSDEALQKVGKGEGKLNLIAWAGYVEDGSTDPASTG